jgi:hypothetical protein
MPIIRHSLESAVTIARVWIAVASLLLSLELARVLNICPLPMVPPPAQLRALHETVLQIWPNPFGAMNRF